MWNVGARRHAGCMIVLVHSLVLLVAVVFIAMSFAPLLADVS